MAYRDLLLHLDTYPTPTPTGAIDEAVAIASALGGKLTGLSFEIDIPLHSNRIADYLIGLSAIAEAEEARSRQACRDGLEHFKATATAAGVFESAVIGKADHYGVGSHVARIARSHDLCILPLVGDYDGQLDVAQEVVFGSGRPILAFRAGSAGGLAQAPGRVVIAWDGSRCAARALADSLPFLARAREVRVMTAVGEKPAAVANLGAEAQRHLSMHGITATLDDIDAGREKIGTVLDRYMKQQAPDLLVMGAFGHSRAREFLLGGATQHVLTNPPCPVLLSH